MSILAGNAAALGCNAGSSGVRLAGIMSAEAANIQPRAAAFPAIRVLSCGLSIQAFSMKRKYNRPQLKTPTFI
ncbi:MAG: hypothetical protein ABL999_19310 [Pyrinomonadaceae bacterium]